MSREARQTLVKETAKQMKGMFNAELERTLGSAYAPSSPSSGEEARGFDYANARATVLEAAGGDGAAEGSGVGVGVEVEADDLAVGRRGRRSTNRRGAVRIRRRVAVLEKHSNDDDENADEHDAERSGADASDRNSGGGDGDGAGVGGGVGGGVGDGDGDGSAAKKRRSVSWKTSPASRRSSGRSDRSGFDADAEDDDSDDNDDESETPQSRVSTAASTGTDDAKEAGSARSTKVRARDTEWARPLNMVVDNASFKTVSMVATLVALFALDFNFAFLPLSVDTATYSIIFSAFIFLCLEILLTCGAKVHYINSFFFWLDVIGTLSVVLDVPWLLGDQDQGDELTVARASRVSRIARSANTLRVTRLFRVFRVFRLLRVVRVFKFFGRKDRAELHDESRKPSKIGLRLVDGISKKVIMLVLILMLVLPILDSTPVDGGEGRASGLALLARTENATVLEGQVDVYEGSYEQELLYLQVHGTVFQPKKAGAIDDLRARELQKFRTVDTDPTSGETFTTGEAWFSIRGQLYLDATFNLLLTLIIILAFGVGTVFMSRDARILVVEPIERMTAIVRKLANTVFFLMHEAGAGDEFGDAQDVSSKRRHQVEDEHDEEYETAVVESLVDKMATLFGVKSPDDGKEQHASHSHAQSTAAAKTKHAGDKRHEKGRYAGAKLQGMGTLQEVSEEEEDEHGASTRGSGVVDYDAGDTSYWSSSESESHNHDEDCVSEMSGTGSNFPINFRKHPELSSLERVLEHPVAYAHFKQCVCADLSLENLLFWEEVEKYRDFIQRTSRRIFMQFLRENAPNQVWIDESQVRVAAASVETGPWIGTFENAQWEVLRSLQRVYHKFLSSTFVEDYFDDKQARIEAGLPHILASAVGTVRHRQQHSIDSNPNGGGDEDENEAKGDE